MMNNLTIQPDANANMTCLQGYVDATYDNLVRALGEPSLGDFDKVTCEWAVTINGVIVTVYNWKTDLDPRYETHWHVGGHDARAVNLVHRALRYR